jgi:copper chaperone CopZ
MKDLNNQKICCQKETKKKGLFIGLLYGIVPHTFCIAFIILTVLGATTATAFLKPFLLNRYFFYILIGLSIFFATISAIIYLEKNGVLSFQGIKRKWKYLSILYGTTIFVNLLSFMVIFPYLANLNRVQPFALIEATPLSSVTLKVDIPCPGHASLISNELKKIDGVEDVKFSFPNLFDVKYNPSKTSKEKLLSLQVFNTYKAVVIKETTSGFQKEKILSQIYSAIEKAKAEGKYKCCIEPPCTMCYLGTWVFEDGTCKCEKMIEKGEFDKVCPECKKESKKEGVDHQTGLVKSFKNEKENLFLFNLWFKIQRKNLGKKV